MQPLIERLKDTLLSFVASLGHSNRYSVFLFRHLRPEVVQGQACVFAQAPNPSLNQTQTSDHLKQSKAKRCHLNRENGLK